MCGELQPPSVNLDKNEKKQKTKDKQNKKITIHKTTYLFQTKKQLNQ